MRKFVPVLLLGVAGWAGAVQAQAANPAPPGPKAAQFDRGALAAVGVVDASSKRLPDLRSLGDAAGLINASARPVEAENLLGAPIETRTRPKLIVGDLRASATGDAPRDSVVGRIVTSRGSPSTSIFLGPSNFLAASGPRAGEAKAATAGASSLLGRKDASTSAMLSSRPASGISAATSGAIRAEDSPQTNPAFNTAPKLLGSATGTKTVAVTFDAAQTGGVILVPQEFGTRLAGGASMASAVMPAPADSLASPGLARAGSPEAATGDPTNPAVGGDARASAVASTPARVGLDKASFGGLSFANLRTAKSALMAALTPSKPADETARSNLAMAPRPLSSLEKPAGLATMLGGAPAYRSALAALVHHRLRPHGKATFIK